MKHIATTLYGAEPKRKYTTPVCTAITIMQPLLQNSSPTVPYNPTKSTGEALSREFDFEDEDLDIGE